MTGILALSNYYFNMFAMPHIVITVISLALGFFVYSQNTRSFTNFSYLAVCVTAALWLGGDAAIMSTQTEQAAKFWARFVYIGITLLPPSLYFFSSSWLGLINKKRTWIFLNYILGLVFIILFLTTDLFVAGYKRHYFGNFSRLGIGSIFYLVYFFGISCAFFKDLIQSYIFESDAVKKLHKKRILLAFLIAFIGALEFLPTYNISIYPIGFLPVLLFNVIVAHAIIRYKLMDIETVVHKTLMWGIASSFIFVPMALLSYWLRPWYQKAEPLNVAVLCGMLFYLFTLYLKLVQPRVDHLFQRRKYDLEGASDKFILDLVHLKSTADLVRKIQNTIQETPYSEGVSIYLYNEKTKSFLLTGTASDRNITELSRNDSFLTWLTKNDCLVYGDFVDLDPKYVLIKNDAQGYFKKIGSVFVIPLVLGERMLGVINLGKRSTLKRYSAYDLQFLLRIKNESTIALSNSLLYGRVEEEVHLRTQELVLIQKQLIQAEKLATVGTLAGGVAHEINNPLTAILTNVQMLLASGAITCSAEDKESLELIEDATKRCRTIVQKLMTYARKPLETALLSRVNLPDVLTSVLSFIGYQLEQDNIKISTGAGEDSYVVVGNPNEMEQVFTNIILNARDAIRRVKKGGTVAVSFSKAGDWVRVEIADEGAGIPKEIASKVFDPFFTTKDVGRGVGLGLSICQSIVEKHGGTVNFWSETGKGTTFSINLPKIIPDPEDKVDLARKTSAKKILS